MSPKAEGIEVCVPVYQCWELAFDTAAAEGEGNGKMYRCEMSKGWFAATGKGAAKEDWFGWKMIT